MKIIGISGPMESGKDTVANILVTRYGYDRVSIGDLIRKELLEVQISCTGTIRSDYIGGQIHIPTYISDMLPSLSMEKLMAKPTSVSIRALLQWYGYTRLQDNPRHWLDQVREQIQSACYSRVVIPDIRMPVEFKYCKDSDGYVWRLVRENSSSNPMESVANHITETSISRFPFDQYIANNGSLEDLTRLVCLLVDGYDLGEDAQGRLWQM